MTFQNFSEHLQYIFDILHDSSQDLRALFCISSTTAADVRRETQCTVCESFLAVDSLNSLLHAACMDILIGVSLVFLLFSSVPSGWPPLPSCYWLQILGVGIAQRGDCDVLSPVNLVMDRVSSLFQVKQGLCRRRSHIRRMCTVVLLQIPILTTFKFINTF